MNGNYASFWQRLAAAIIDSVLFGILSSLLSGVLGGGSGSILDYLPAVLYWVYAVYMLVTYGATLGKMALKIRVESETTGANLTWKEAFLREVVGKFLSSILLALGYLWVLWDPKKQGWHDKLGKSVVVKAAK